MLTLPQRGSKGRAAAPNGGVREEKASCRRQLPTSDRRVSWTQNQGSLIVADREMKLSLTILVDIGLWQSICGVNVEVEYHKSDLLSIYRGAMAEQFVGQEMMLSQNSNLYYWARQARGSIAEVDYLAVVDGGIVPIEVKSGAAVFICYSKHIHVFRLESFFRPDHIQSCRTRGSSLSLCTMHVPRRGELCDKAAQESLTGHVA